MHFYVMISVFLSNRIYQNSSKKRKDRTSYLVIYLFSYLNESSFPNLIKPPRKKLTL